MELDIINEQDLFAFKNRKIKAKNLFTIKEIDKNTCYAFVRRYHYLANAKFFCVYGYGMYYTDENGNKEMVGCATFSNPQGAVSLKGWFGLGNECDYVLELSRLCLLPCLNNTNATSFLLGNSIKMLKKHGIKAVITLADASRHVGSIYQVCNFKYYGLSDKKCDFYTVDGIKNFRGSTACRHGVWVERTRKHRYCYLLDKKLKVLYQEKEYPKQVDKFQPNCCGGTKKVFDNRFKEWYTCPICCGYIQKLGDEKAKRYQIKNVQKYDDYGQLNLFENY